jgi:hypothetical protein
MLAQQLEIASIVIVIMTIDENASRESLEVPIRRSNLVIR